MKKSKNKIFRNNELLNIKHGGGWTIKYHSDNKDVEGPDSIFGALTNLANQTYKGTVRVGSVLGEGAVEQFNKSAEAFAKYGLYAVGTAVDWSIYSTVGSDIDNKSMGELTQTSISKLQKLVSIMSEMAKDPELRELLRKVGKIIGDLLEQTLETARVPLKNATVKAIDLSRDIGKESVAGMTSFAVDMVSVAASEVPVLGGVVDMTIAIGRAFNSGAAAFKKGTSNSIMIIEIMNKLISEILPKIDVSVDEGIEAKRKLQTITKRFVDMINGSSNSINDVSTGISNNVRDISKQRGGKKKRKDIIVQMFNSTYKKRASKNRKTRKHK